MSDVVIAMTSWLKSNGYPANAYGPVGDAAQVVVYRVGGGDGPSLIPTDDATLGIDVWGDSTNPSVSATAQMKDSIRSRFARVQGKTAMGGRTVFGMTVQSERWLPDPDTDQPRFALTVSVPALIPAT